VVAWGNSDFVREAEKCSCVNMVEAIKNAEGATLQKLARRGSVTTPLVVGLLAIGVAIGALAYYEASDLEAKTTTVTMGGIPAEADVAATSVSCSHITGTCTITLSNTGDAPATVTGCSIYGAAGTMAGQTTIIAGSSENLLTCGMTSGTATAGEALSGAITLSSGIVVGFVGRWS